MLFTKIASLLTAATLASAINQITFVSLDETNRTLIFTGNPNDEYIEPMVIPGMSNVTVNFTDTWTGNFYSVSDGMPNIPGMLGEIAWNSWLGITFFDVSAIVNPADHVGVKEMFPANSTSPRSGCTLFPCNAAYYQPDDIQTKSTTEELIICTLGNEISTLDVRAFQEDDSPVFPRDFVLGKWSAKAKRAARRAAKALRA
jgi:hypothetical protein